ncbi:MAG: glycerol-3-phosphate acyltransferase [Promethearchaeota archaeon]|nr:MAG: glycerol-3-phosphate acyltransferase [Candidatus Lokiarchaeota archaeon]
MDLWLILFSCFFGYLFGSISFSRIFLRIIKPKESMDNLKLKLDNSEDEVNVMMGSGANKASIILGTKWGIIIGILDMIKVIIPLIIFRYIIFPTDPYFLYVAAFGLIGHNWPIFYRFKGGRGHSVMLGSLIVIDWLAVIINIILGNLLGFALLGSLVFASYLWLWMMIPWFLLSTFNINFVIYGIFINIIAILSQIPEITLFIQLRKEGKDREYKEKITEMTAQFRGLQKMENFFKSLGKWRIVIGISTLIGTIMLYLFLPLIS